MHQTLTANLRESWPTGGEGASSDSFVDPAIDANEEGMAGEAGDAIDANEEGPAGEAGDAIARNEKPLKKVRENNGEEQKVEERRKAEPAIRTME